MKEFVDDVTRLSRALGCADAQRGCTGHMRGSHAGAGNGLVAEGRTKLDEAVDQGRGRHGGGPSISDRRISGKEKRANFSIDHRRVFSRNRFSFSSNRSRLRGPSLSNAYLKGFRSGASSCEIVRSRPRTTTLSAWTRWRTQTRIGAGRAPNRAFGSKAVRPNDTLRHPISMAS